MGTDLNDGVEKPLLLMGWPSISNGNPPVPPELRHHTGGMRVLHQRHRMGRPPVQPLGGLRGECPRRRRYRSAGNGRPSSSPYCSCPAGRRAARRSAWAPSWAPRSCWRRSPYSACGLSVLLFRKRRRTSTLHINGKLVRRDLAFFMVAYSLAAFAAIAPPQLDLFKQVLGGVLADPVVLSFKCPGTP